MIPFLMAYVFSYAIFNLHKLLDLLTKAKKLLEPTVVPAEQ